MRPISPAMLAKIKNAYQTIYNDSDPKIDIMMRRTRRYINTDESIMSRHVRQKEGLGGLDLAMRREDARKNPDIIFMIYVDNGVAKVASQPYGAVAASQGRWTDIFDLGTNVVDVAVEFDGFWNRASKDAEVCFDDPAMWTHITHGDPWFFWVTNDGKLLARQGMEGDILELVGSGVTQCSAIRAWKSTATPHHDNGLVIAYVRNGKIRYRALCEQESGERAWEAERVVDDSYTVDSVTVFVTNDFRTGFIGSSNGELFAIFSERNWAGMSVLPDYVHVPEHELRESQMGILDPLVYLDKFHEDTQANTGKLPVHILNPLTSVVPLAWVGDTINKILEVWNEPIDDDWGKILYVRMNHLIDNPSFVDFAIFDTFNRSYIPDSLEVIIDGGWLVSNTEMYNTGTLSPYIYKLEFHDFNNFNNVDQQGILRFSPIQGTNGKGELWDADEKTFYPLNLVPIPLPRPEFVSAFSNPEGTQLTIALTEPIIPMPEPIQVIDNVALSKPYTAGPGNLDNRGTSITNGQTATQNYISVAGTAPAWVLIDLFEPVTVDKIIVWHYYLDNRTYHSTKTEVSVDGEEWFVIFDSAVEGTYSETEEGKTHEFSARQVRYIRDWVNGSTSNTGNHWVEIKVFNEEYDKYVIDNGFKLTGQEYRWINGPDNNGELQPMEVTVDEVTTHPDTPTQVVLHSSITNGPYNHLCHLVGPLTIEYDSIFGGVSGMGGAMEDFEVVVELDNLKEIPTVPHGHMGTTHIPAFGIDGSNMGNLDILTFHDKYHGGDSGETYDFFDDFNREELGDDWTVESGFGEIVDNTLRIRPTSSGGHRGWVSLNENYDLKTIEFDWYSDHAHNMGADMRIKFLVDGGLITDTAWSQEGYQIQWEVWSSAQNFPMRLYRLNGPASSTALGHFELPLEGNGNVWHETKIEIDDTHIRVYHNGELKIDVEDSTYRGERGLILGAREQALRTVFYDNIYINRVSSQGANIAHIPIHRPDLSEMDELEYVPPDDEVDV